jgi:hypothetical protein
VTSSWRFIASSTTEGDGATSATAAIRLDHDPRGTTARAARAAAGTWNVPRKVLRFIRIKREETARL